MTLRPGEIYYADFGDDPDHRAVIVSREELNRGTYVVTVPFSLGTWTRRTGEVMQEHLATIVECRQAILAFTSELLDMQNELMPKEATSRFVVLAAMMAYNEAKIALANAQMELLKFQQVPDGFYSLPRKK